MKVLNSIKVLGLVTLIGCSPGQKEKRHGGSESIEVIEEVEVGTPHNLKLNDGVKWNVDKGIADGIIEINKSVQKRRSHDVLDYQLLGDAIAIQTQYIISNCTLKGEAHKELHKWLLPFLDLKEALVMTASPEEGAAVLENIKYELLTYNTYFN